MGMIFLQSLHGQKVEYKHSLFDIGFMASPSWEQELHDYNGKIFQVTNPNNNMCINLSFIPNCRGLSWLFFPGYSNEMTCCSENDHSVCDG